MGICAEYEDPSIGSSGNGMLLVLLAGCSVSCIKILARCAVTFTPTTQRISRLTALSSVQSAIILFITYHIKDKSSLVKRIYSVQKIFSRGFVLLYSCLGILSLAADPAGSLSMVRYLYSSVCLSPNSTVNIQNTSSSTSQIDSKFLLVRIVRECKPSSRQCFLSEDARGQCQEVK